MWIDPIFSFKYVCIVRTKLHIDACLYTYGSACDPVYEVCIDIIELIV